jgi:ketosteroid isomerase-like protein
MTSSFTTDLDRSRRSAPLAVAPRAAGMVSSLLDRRRAAHHALWERYKRLLIAQDFQAWTELWTHDARLVVVDAREERSGAVEGREAVTAAFTRMAARVERLKLKDVSLHQTMDPDVFVVSYLLEAMFGKGARYVSSIVARVRTRDGRIAEIVESVDGPSHTAFLEAIERAA